MTLAACLRRVPPLPTLVNGSSRCGSFGERPSSEYGLGTWRSNKRFQPTPPFRGIEPAALAVGQRAGAYCERRQAAGFGAAQAAQLKRRTLAGIEFRR
jgi:hypothetical protein